MKVTQSTKSVLLVATLMGGAMSHAHAADEHADAVKAAQDKLQASFSNLTVTDFGPAPIDGLYEVNTGGKIIYYSPGKELLFFGEIFSKDGRSLTKEKVALEQSKKTKDLPLDLALKIGNGPTKVVEFTDPDCPYCQRYHTYMKGKQKDVTRYVFFTPLRAIHPESASKAVHILCAKDKQKAFADMFEGRISPSELKECEVGKELLAKHEELSHQFGVSGTPTLVMGQGTVITGFDQAQIAQYLTTK